MYFQKLYVPKSKCNKEKWEAYKKAKRKGMTRYRAKKKEASLQASVPSWRGRSTVRTPPEEFRELPARTRRKKLSTTPATDNTNPTETPTTDDDNLSLLSETPSTSSTSYR